jgi:hypothetical protein
MTRGRVEPFAVPTMVKAVPLVVHVVKRTTTNTINDISTREIAKGTKAGNTTDDIAIGKTVVGIEPRS